MSGVGADIRVRGMVQGVGFRHNCWRHASRLDLAGWVRNLPDGSVALHAEGNRGAIESLIDEIKIGPGASSVSDVIVTWTPFSGQFNSFEITR